MMACVVCHGAHFRHQVVEVGRVGALATPEGRELYTTMEFLDQHPALFQQLDRRWCCRQCMTSMAAGRMPPMAARNGLAAPWVGLPTSLLDLTKEELEVTSLNQVSPRWRAWPGGWRELACAPRRCSSPSSG